MKTYLDIVRKVLEEGVVKENRTGVDTLAIAGAYFEHDMKDGFPLLTTKHVPFNLIASELEFFIKGLTDKNWLNERGNHIWDEWCNPTRITYGNDNERKKQMKQENDLGPIYGWQWRHYGEVYVGRNSFHDTGIDQLKNLVETLKKNPGDRRMLVTAWNPLDINQMALPPCHYAFQVTVIDGVLNLLWNQRSVDVALGLPFNIASYALLLHLLAKEAGLKEGKLVGFLADTHIYENHMEGIEEQLKRKSFSLPTVETKEFSSIFDWEYTDTNLIDYGHHPKIKFEVAV